jgi:hypothetical protein
LFSHPTSNAIGETNDYGRKPHPPKDEENGKPITEPRNFFTKNGEKGPAIDRTLIGKPGYISVGDPYRMRSANDAMRTHVKDGHTKAGHDVAFKPAK